VKYLILVLTLSLQSSFAQAFSGYSDDSDLLPLGPRPRHTVSSVLRPDSVTSESRADGTEVRVLRWRSPGQWEAIEGIPVSLIRGAEVFSGQTDMRGSIQMNCAGTQVLAGRLDLKDSKFEISGGREVYSVAFEAECGKTTTLNFQSATDGGQALGIWQIARSAERRLQDSVGLSFWKRPVRFIWPGNGDYYSFGQVNITRGDYWDVVGHELGHAIYDMADIGAFGGGQHKIDECYTDRLALSEGWASYFSAWLGVDLADADAKFEFMVPRRAPIRFENVPADVCLGHKSEWRVTSFLWDLIDLNRDSESMEETFARVWHALAGSDARSAVDVAASLQKAGFSPELLDLVWELNFGLKRPAL